MQWLTVFLTLKDSGTAIIQTVKFFADRNKSKLEKDQFERLTSESFENVRKYLKRIGLKQQEFCPGRKENYIDALLNSTKQKNGFYLFSKGEIEAFFFDNFIIPKENRFNIFAKYSFLFLEGYDEYFRFSLLKERVVKLLTKKKTVFHYMTIPGWSNLDYKKLINTVEKIKKATPIHSERFTYTKIQDIEEKAPTISKAIDKVLESGKISERTVLNLASSEKILIVHKYSEGFGEVYKKQEALLAAIKGEIQELETSNDPERENKIRSKKQERKEVIESWVRTPINTTLEEFGFQKLFNRMQGVYIYPVFMLPEKYHSDYKTYIKDIVLLKAQKLLKRMKKTQNLLHEHTGGLKYVLLAHVIPLNEISVFTQERELGISSPILYRLLFKSYLFKNSSDVSSIYINDIVRNIDILNLWDKDTKSAIYLRKHFEFLKQILWDEYRVEIYKPVSLIILSADDVGDICEKLYKNDSSIAPHHVRKLLLDTIDFYNDLNKELDEIKLK